MAELRKGGYKFRNCIFKIDNILDATLCCFNEANEAVILAQKRILFGYKYRFKVASLDLDHHNLVYCCYLERG